MLANLKHAQRDGCHIHNDNKISNPSAICLKLKCLSNYLLFGLFRSLPLGFQIKLKEIRINKSFFCSIILLLEAINYIPQV